MLARPDRVAGPTTIQMCMLPSTQQQSRRQSKRQAAASSREDALSFAKDDVAALAETSVDKLDRASSISVSLEIK